MLSKEFEYCICVHWFVWSYFQQFIENFMPRLGKKGQTFNYINVNKKYVYLIQFKLRNPMFAFYFVVQRLNHA